MIQCCRLAMDGETTPARAAVQPLSAGAKPSAKHLGNAPRLRNTSTWPVRWRGVKHLAHLAEARGLKMPLEPDQQLARSHLVRIELQLRPHEMSKQPRPNGTLRIRGVARSQVAV